MIAERLSKNYLGGALVLMTFFDEVFIPFRDFNDQIFVAVGNTLAGKS